MQRRSLVSISVGVCAILAAGSALGEAPPAPGPVPPAAAVSQAEAARFLAEQRQLIAEVAGKTERRTAPRPVNTMVRLDLEADHLVARQVDRSIPDQTRFALPHPEEGAVFFQQLSFEELPTETFRLQILRLDPARLSMLHTELGPIPGRVTLTVTIDTPTGTNTSELIEKWAPLPFEDEVSEPRITVRFNRYVNIDDDAGESFMLEGTTFVELLDRSEQELHNLLAPGLMSMRSMTVLAGVGEAEARVILESDRPLDPQTVSALHRLASELDKRGADAIEELRERLRKMGPAAVLQFQMLSRAGWSVDLCLNADTLCANLLPTRVSRAQRLLDSPNRLVNLLYANDVNVRKAVLERLSRRVKTPVAIDPQKDPYEQTEAIESLRIALASQN